MFNVLYFTPYGYPLEGAKPLTSDTLRSSNRNVEKYPSRVVLLYGASDIGPLSGKSPYAILSSSLQAYPAIGASN